VSLNLYTHGCVANNSPGMSQVENLFPPGQCMQPDSDAHKLNK
jgi:hypothetical protein